MKDPGNRDWMKATFEERFAEVERLRREFWKGKYDENTRIQKIIRIIKKGKVVKVIDARNPNVIKVTEYFRKDKATDNQY